MRRVFLLVAFGEDENFGGTLNLGFGIADFGLKKKNSGADAMWNVIRERTVPRSQASPARSGNLGLRIGWFCLLIAVGFSQRIGGHG
jgi:hypothetical protein